MKAGEELERERVEGEGRNHGPHAPGGADGASGRGAQDLETVTAWVERASRGRPGSKSLERCGGGQGGRS